MTTSRRQVVSDQLSPEGIATNLAAMRATASGHSHRDLTAVALADLVEEHFAAEAAWQTVRFNHGQERANAGARAVDAENALRAAVKR